MGNNALELVINNYIARHKIDTYTLTPARWLARDWKTKLQLGNGIAFFYGMRAMFPERLFNIEGTGLNQSFFIADYEKGNIRLESSEGETGISHTQRYLSISEQMRYACVDSDFIAIHTSEVQLKHGLTYTYLDSDQTPRQRPLKYIPVTTGYFNYLLLVPISSQC